MISVKDERRKAFEYIKNYLVFDPKGSHDELGKRLAGPDEEVLIQPKGQSVGYKIPIPYMKWCDVYLTQKSGIIINPGGIFGSKIRNVVREQTPSGDILWRYKGDEFNPKPKVLEADGSKYDVHACEYIFWLQIKKEGLGNVRKLITPNFKWFISN